MSSDAQTQKKTSTDVVVKLRIEFVHRPIKKRFLGRKYPFLIQNEPIEYGLRVKNIGETSFSGALVKDFNITVPNVVVSECSKSPKIKPLNPGEVTEMYFDILTMLHEGSIHTQLSLVPENPSEVIETYQYLKDHDKDEVYLQKNKWWQDYYCQGQLQLLQATTNNLILLLTAVTVVEAVFGINSVLKFAAKTLSWCFDNLALFFQWLAG